VPPDAPHDGLEQQRTPQPFCHRRRQAIVAARNAKNAVAPGRPRLRELFDQHQ
jgi:hypothetical protein